MCIRSNKAIWCTSYYGWIINKNGNKVHKIYGMLYKIFCFKRLLMFKTGSNLPGNLRGR